MRELERELRELGGELEWPRTPELAPAVAARIRPPERRRLARLSLVLALLAAALVAVAEPTARSAILELLRIGGVRVERGEPPAQVPVERVAPGRRVALSEAAEAAAFPLVVPSGYESVHLAGAGAGADAIVTFAWSDRLLSQFRGDELLLKKVASDGTDVEWLEVEGLPALWIEGAPHGLFLPGGEARLAGNVLIWVRDGVTFRLEGELDRAEALTLAGTLTPPRS